LPLLLPMTLLPLLVMMLLMLLLAAARTERLALEGKGEGPRDDIEANDEDEERSLASAPALAPAAIPAAVARPAATVPQEKSP
jgi:hypothetical protein